MKRVVMCQPQFYEVAYAINAWMDPARPVDKTLADLQWQSLAGAYQKLGITVATIDPVDGLPDMVFAADNGLAIGNKVALGRFLYPERQPETEWYKNWFKNAGYKTFLPSTVFEGGDVRVTGETIFIGYGFRTAQQSHTEIGRFFGRQVISLKLVDKRFYHMDTAFCPLDQHTAMYFPAAFDKSSRELIKKHFESLIEVSEKDALAFGLNSVCVDRDIIISNHAVGLIRQLQAANYSPIPLDFSEFQKAGGGINCLTLQLR